MKKFTQFNGKKIHYHKNGSGRTLVLLHGYLESLEMWEAHQRILSSKYQIISIDLPGHGKSDQVEEVHSMALMADVVKAVLYQEKISKCVLIGHSMGGYTTLAFARKYPEMLLGFGLFHSHASADDEAGKKNRVRTIEIIKQDKGHFINQFIPSLFAPENIARLDIQIKKQISLANSMTNSNIIAAMAGMMERESSLDILMDTQVPVLFIIGKRDSRIPLEKVLAQSSIPITSQILILGNAGHMSWIEEQQKTIAEIDGFMTLCESSH